MDERELDDILDTWPTLAGVGRFAGLIRGCPWFRHVGDPMTAELARDARLYAGALGFPEAEPAVLAAWEDAAAAGESLDFNAPAWEAEEHLRRTLAARAEELVDPAALELVLTHISAVAADAVSDGAEAARAFLLIDDDAFLRAATGAGVQACYSAALVLAAGEGADHPLSLKFQIFEHGRWPVSIIGGSLNIF